MRKKILIALFVIFLAGSFIRLYPAYVNSRPIAYDSYYHVRIAELIKQTGTIPTTEPWPLSGRPHIYLPVYHLVLAGLSYFSALPVIFIVRFFLPLFACATILAAFWLANKFTNDLIALLTAFFIAFNPFLIPTSYDSPQVLALFLAIFAVFLFLKQKFISSSILLAIIFLTNSFVSAIVSIPMLLMILFEKNMKALRVFALPIVVLCAWYLAHWNSLYCADNFIGPYFIDKSLHSLLFTEAAMIVAVLAISCMMFRGIKNNYHKFWTIWLAFATAMFLSFVITPFFHPWRQDIFIAFAFSFFLPVLLVKARSRNLITAFYGLIFLGGLLVVIMMGGMRPPLHLQDYAAINWADANLPADVLMHAHHDICASWITYAGKRCTLDIYFECIPNKAAWFELEDFFWKKTPAELAAIFDRHAFTHIIYSPTTPNYNVLEEMPVNKIYAAWDCSDKCYKETAIYERRA